MSESAQILAKFGMTAQQASSALGQAAKAINALGGSIRKQMETWRGLHRQTLPYLRTHHGGNGRDARLWPDLWQSAVCSAWLHESCPSDANGLGCTCGCHGTTP